MRRVTIVIGSVVLLTAAIVFFVTSQAGTSTKEDGVSALERGDYGKACKLLEVHLENVPHDFATRSLLANGYLQRREFGDAVDHYLVLSDNPEYREAALRSLAGIAITMKETDLAEQSLSSLIKISPDDFAVNLAFAEFYFETGRPERAIPFVRRCISAQPQRAQSYLLLADILGDLNRDSEMVVPLEICVQLTPEEITPRANLAHAYLAAGNSRAAFLEAQWCLARRPDLHSVRLILARAFRDEGDIDASLQQVEAVITAEPSNLDAALLEADLLFFLGRGKEVYSRLIRFYDDHTDDRQLVSHLMRASVAIDDAQELQKFRDRLTSLLAE